MNLQDVFLIERVTVINEGKNSERLKIRGVFQRADEANNNKRRYPKRVLENQIKQLNESIMNRRLVGELDHPTYDVVKLSNASHLITGLYLEGNEVIGEAEILPTPAGKVVEGLIKGGVQIGISSRGLGSLTENKDGTKTVNEDFKLLTFDIVADPSTRGAFPSLTESTDYKETQNFVEKTIKTVVAKNLALRVLEAMINSRLEEANMENKRKTPFTKAKPFNKAAKKDWEDREGRNAIQNRRVSDTGGSAVGQRDAKSGNDPHPGNKVAARTVRKNDAAMQKWKDRPGKVAQGAMIKKAVVESWKRQILGKP